MNKTVLLTGGAGFIGSHLAESYLKEDYTIVIVDNLYSGYYKNIEGLVDNKKVFFYNVDIRDKESLENIFKTHKPSIINHHAAQKSVPYSIEDPVYDLSVNLHGLLTILSLVPYHKIENFIYVSSGGALSKEIIGNEKSKETDFPQLESPYAITKFSGENYLRIYSKLYDFKFTVLRYGNVYGPRQVPAGECGVIPIFINNILDGKESILTTYDDMKRGCTRDYINVKDVADINMIVSKNPTNEVFNISTGNEIYILDIYEEIKEVFHSNLGIDIKGPRIGDVRRSVLDISKVKSMLGWEPKISLRDGLQDLYEYIKK
ncbi:MAG: SDR family NAD(P)-dependent oxidoreductase [Oscillospiraceae bacterium]|nr:SDR family NAD(P)-dependent oxidoreductase [Oscillospiraceae bacterium]